MFYFPDNTMINMQELTSFDTDYYLISSHHVMTKVQSLQISPVLPRVQHIV